MPFVRLWVHLVWSTKKREPLLLKPIRSKLFEHIKTNAEKKHIHILEINGYTDHVHVLVSLKSTQSVSKVANLIKGESSYWGKKKDILPSHFEWQTEYYAVSVGLVEVNYVRRYIQNQEHHHAENSFRDEIETLRMNYFGGD